MRRSKYGNKKSGKYDSKREHERADLLRILEKNGNISNLQEQVKFELIPAQYKEKKVLTKRGYQTKKVCVERSCSYYADFTYTSNNTGLFVVEDAKGVRTKEYNIKRKLMLQVHNIEIKEV